MGNNLNSSEYPLYPIRKDQEVDFYYMGRKFFERMGRYFKSDSIQGFCKQITKGEYDIAKADAEMKVLKLFKKQCMVQRSLFE